jgi:hypothetical protein
VYYSLLRVYLIGKSARRIIYVTQGICGNPFILLIESEQVRDCSGRNFGHKLCSKGTTSASLISLYRSRCAPFPDHTMSKPHDPTLAQREAMTESYNTFLRNTSWTMLFLAPALIALPPRKLDLYTAALAASFVASANHLTKERTGRGLLANLPFANASRPPGPKTKAEEFHEKYRVEKERRRLLGEPAPSSTATSAGRPPSALKTAAKELWMGGETEGWKERRLQEEQEKIKQGEGYGSMIVDQIWEVWNWGEKKEEIKDKDKQFLNQREQDERARKREEEFPKIGKDGR